MNNRDFPNSGILFVNDRKKGERDPDHKGNADVTCPLCGRSTNFLLSAWRKMGQRSGEFLSLSFRPKDGAEVRARPAHRDGDIEAALPLQRGGR